MLTVGHHITQPNDPLRRVDLEYVVQQVSHPSPALSSQIAQLRQVRMLDERLYKRQKTALPYFCSGIFHPLARRKENFAVIHSFVLDFDAFNEEGVGREEAFARLKADPRVAFLFRSPSGDGVKAVFLLDKPCTDFGLYSYFYKAFLQQFVLAHQLEQYADYVTHDVTRATFFSTDPDAYYHPGAERVAMEQYASLARVEGAVEREFDELRKASAQERQAPASTLNEDTLVQIKQKINPDYRPKREEKLYYVPEEVRQLLPQLEAMLHENGLALAEAKPIQYGKQLRITAGALWAELNLFYGKRGYTVVKTTKTGSNADLCELGSQLINQWLGH